MTLLQYNEYYKNNIIDFKERSGPVDMEDREKNEVKRLVLLATMAGKIMIKNGAETYRVEDTLQRICTSQPNIKYADAFVLPTGIFVSLEYDDDMFTYFTRVTSVKIDLDKINLVNDFSREFVRGDISINEGIRMLKQINKTPNYNNLTKTIFGAFASACFSVLFGGVFRDFVASYIISFTTIFILNKLSRHKLSFFLNNFIGSAMVTVLSIVFVKLGLGKNMDMVIIGSIMSMLPGVAITNAMRDTMSGDFTSGLSRAMEATFSALAIAFGVGVILNFYIRG